MERFLAIHPLPAGNDARSGFTRLAREAHAVGVHSLESVWSEERGVAYHILEADERRQVLGVFDLAGLPEPDVFPVDHVHTDLLAKPRRSR